MFVGFGIIGLCATLLLVFAFSKFDPIENWKEDCQCPTFLSSLNENFEFET